MIMNVLNRYCLLQTYYRCTLASIALPNINGVTFYSNNSKLPFSNNKTVTERKRIGSSKITLISTDESVVTSSLEEAQQLSRRRDLKLVKIIDFDTKTKRPVYRLMTGSDYHEEELRKRSERQALKRDESTIKGEKLLTISGKITDHDLSARVKNLLKWLDKHYEVKVVLNGDADNMESVETLYSKLETELSGNGKILQKRNKGSDIRFQIQPILKKDLPIINGMSSRSINTYSRSL